MTPNVRPAPDGRPPRVLGFCDYIGPATSGGAERATREIASRLAASGIDIELVGAHPAAGATETVQIGEVTATVLPGRDLSRRLGAQVMVAPGLHAHARRRLAVVRPDVLYAVGLHFHSSLVAARLSRSTGIPLVLHAHLGSVENLPARVRVPTNLYERSLGRFLIRSATSVVAVSDATRNHLVDLGADPSAVHVVHNGVDHDRFGPPADPTPTPRGGDQIVVLGRLIANKGPGVALSAFARLRHHNTRLVYVGDGPLRRRLEADAAALGVSGRVHFSGEVDDVVPFLRRASIVVRASQTEGQSLAVLEAMACGVCVIASDIGPNRELIRDGVNGAVVPTGDVEALARRLDALLADPQTRSRLAEAGRRSARRYDWDRCASATGEILQQAAAPTNRNHPAPESLGPVDGGLPAARHGARSRRQRR